MDFNAFSHGQIQSKQWLCENIENYIPKNSRVAVLGCWYNVLSLMMLTRDHNRYQYFLGIDIDPEAISIANKICQAWMLSNVSKANNIVADANEHDISGFNVVINCSPEHMEENNWFDNIDSGALVCIQSSDLDINDDQWKIVNPNYTLDSLQEKYPLNHIISSKKLDIRYDSWGYSRLMLIGTK